jgi:hypothetical protein
MRSKYYTKINRSNYHVHHNAACIKCDALHKEMIRVGAVIFCEKCIAEEFSSDDPVHDERSTYLIWLHKSWREDE